MANNKTSNDESFIEMIVNKYNESCKVGDLSKEYDVPRSTIYKWIKDRQGAVSLKEYNELKKQIEELSIENKLLRETNEMIKSKDIVKIAEVIEKTPYTNVKALCKIFGISRESYYKTKTNENVMKEKNGQEKLIASYSEMLQKNRKAKIEKYDEIKESKEVTKNDKFYHIQDNVVFDEIDINAYEEINNYFKKELGINTECIEVNGNVIKSIYNHCNEMIEKSGLSWGSIKDRIISHFPVINEEYKIYTNYDTMIEDSIYNHCIVSALYTVEYLMYKNTNITASSIGYRLKGMGHNFLLKEKEFKNKFNIDENYIRFNKLNEFIKAFQNDDYNYNEYNKIRNNLEEFKKMKQENKNPFLLQIIDIKPDKIELPQKTSTPLFLSNFTYKILSEMISLKNFEEIIRCSSDKIGIKFKNKVIDRYFGLNTKISYYDDYTHIVDKVIFEVEKERHFNKKYIDYCTEKNILADADDFFFQHVKAVMAFPNVMSRKYIIHYLRYIYGCYGEDCTFTIREILYYTISFYEKVFFTTLYGYFSNQVDDEGEVLKSIDDLLIKYIDDNNYKNLLEGYVMEKTVLPDIDITKIYEKDYDSDFKEHLSSILSNFVINHYMENHFDDLEILTKSYINSEFEEIINLYDIKKNVTDLNTKRKYSLIEFIFNELFDFRKNYFELIRSDDKLGYYYNIESVNQFIKNIKSNK